MWHDEILPYSHTVIVQLYKRIQSKSCDYIGLHISSVDEV